MTVHAPYNFVTLSRFVYEPPFGERISHDIPFSDGLSGEFDIEITAHSKILIGGERSKTGEIETVAPFKLPDGAYAIPESSLRGMIRNVLEIAAFGRMQTIDDKRFGIRDLNDSAKPYYRDRIIKKGARAGWLWFDGASETPGWKITHCEMARVKFDMLEALSDNLGPSTRGIPWRSRGEAKDRYGSWKHENLRHELVLFAGERETFARVPKNGEAKTSGALVFTGNTGVPDPKKAKKAEFFFYDREDKASAIPVPQAVYDGAKAIHTPNDGRQQNSSWLYWHDRWKADTTTEIPVFYIADENKVVASFGLAMMFKLAHELSLKQIVANTSAKHGQDGLIDLPTALFGYAADNADGASVGLKSRVHLGLAKCLGKPDGRQPAMRPEEATVLSGPKPSYFPSYIRQPVEDNDDSWLRSSANDRSRIYATYTPLHDQKAAELRHPEIRGWKRYPAGGTIGVKRITDASIKKKVQVILKPLEAGARFRSRVRFHNLRPFELGALLWALEWGGNLKLRHRLGMGKPYGFGQISIKVIDASLDLRPNACSVSVSSKAEYIAAFTKRMDEAYRDAVQRADGKPLQQVSWAKSEQITALLAMADPEIGQSKIGSENSLDYMELKPFAEAKKAYLTLPYYVDLPPKGSRDHDIWPRDVPPIAPTPSQPQQNMASRPQGKQAPSPSSAIGSGDTVTWIEEQIEVRVISVASGFAAIEIIDTGEVVEDIRLNVLVKSGGDGQSKRIR
jgi:CRISPR-associated protein (TIGR03986 family)